MTVGQREKITYRGNLVRMNRADESFLPAQGVGAGVGEGLGMVLNRVIRGSPSYRVIRRVTGAIVAETPDSVTLELRDGQKLKIPVSDIILRKVFA